MEKLLIYGLIIGFFTAFLVLLVKKLGITEYFQVNGNDFISKLFSCNFCMSWWVSVILSVILVVATKDVSFIFCPFISTVIARFLEI